MGNRRTFDRDRICLYVAVAAVLFSVVYWSLFSLNAYNTYHEYEDLGFATLSMYYHIYYPNAISGLEYLVFWNHIAPDQLLLLPIFYLFQSPLTLLLAQAIVLSLTGLLIFFIVRDIAKSSGWALLFCLVYLLNPGMHGIMIFDYHAEFLIPPLFLLTFYYYMKLNRNAMLCSLVLLLGTIETAPFLALFLGIALFGYDFFYTKEKKVRDARLRSAFYIVASSIIAIIVYTLITSYLTHSYQTSYAGLPIEFRVGSFGAAQFSGAVTALLGGHVTSTSFPYYGVYLAYGLVVALLCFGALVLFDPIVTLVLAIPWLANVFILQNSEFVVVWSLYFSYVLPGTIVAAILGLIQMQNGKGPLSNLLLRLRGPQYRKFAVPFAISSIAVITFFLLLVYPSLVYSTNVNNLSQDFLFNVNATQQTLYTQLNSVVALVPANASLLTQYFIVPHVADREYLEEFPPYYNVTFTPQYVLVDDNLNISLNSYDDKSAIGNFIAANPDYQIVASNGTAILYKLNATA